MSKQDSSSIFSNRFLLFCLSGRRSSFFCRWRWAAANYPSSLSSLAEPLRQLYHHYQAVFYHWIRLCLASISHCVQQPCPSRCLQESQWRAVVRLWNLLLSEQHHVTPHRTLPLKFFLGGLLNTTFGVSFRKDKQRGNLSSCWLCIKMT